MKRPFTGGEVIFQEELRTIGFRMRKFQIQFQYYLCKESGERFTDDALDEVNSNQV